MSELTTFSFVNEINYGKTDIMDETNEKVYIPFIVNKSLSFNIETLYCSEEMNLNSCLDNRLQFDFLLHTVRKGKRFSKWLKKLNNNDVKLISEYYGFSIKKAEMALSLLSPEQISEIKQKLNSRENSYGK